MADLFDGNGLMNLYANPQTAGLLGMGAGLLSASGPSRLPVSMGQALGMGMQGAEQGFNNSLQMQRGLLQMRAMQGLMGGDQSAAAPQSAPSYSSLFGPASSAPATMAPSGVGGTQDGSSASGAPTAAGSIYGRTPQQLFQQGMLMNMAGIQGGGDLMRVAVEHDPTLARMMPTDIQKNAAAAYGYGTPEYTNAIQGAVRKEGVVPLRPGAGYIDQGVLKSTPGPAPAGYMNQPNGDGTWSIVPVAGGPEAVRSSAAAQAGGKAQYNLQQVWDPTANNGQGGFVYQSAANVADSAGGNAPPVPVGIRNNNFGNIRSADGKGFATYDTPQAGINAADELLATYGAKHGINTIMGIANRWSPTGDGNNNPAQKAAAMSAASGVGVNEPINLADPATRARILPALFDTETPGWRNAVGGGTSAPAAAPARGPMASQPPLGTTNAANASQGAPSKQMADSYSAMSGADNAYQQSREALTEMIDLANRKGASGAVAGVLPESVSTKISPDAAKYQKLHATYVSLQGKALGSGGTDAARATIDEAVPTYDKPQSAMVSGLQTQLNNLDMAHLKTQFLTPTYQRGDEKSYTAQSAAFDQNIKPSMVPVLQMQGPQQRAAVQAAIKANPSLRSSYEWAFNNGMLK
jgi:hypothetical protein